VSITQENAKRTGLRSLGGGEFVIKFNPHGYYVIDVDGPGGKPAICNELFTGVNYALQAVSRYCHENAAEFAKQEIIAKHGGPKRNAKEGVRE
jgi:hypothetical protein